MARNRTSKRLSLEGRILAVTSSSTVRPGSARRVSFAKFQEPIEVPNLLDLQTESFARLIGAPWTLALAAWTLAAQAAYLSLGLVRLGREGARIRDLLHAPGYILWKGTLYIKVLAGRGTRIWVRGHRNIAGRVTPEE